jgi:hypothetical protein
MNVRHHVAQNSAVLSRRLQSSLLAAAAGENGLITRSGEGRYRAAAPGKVRFRQLGDQHFRSRDSKGAACERALTEICTRLARLMNR